MNSLAIQLMPNYTTERIKEIMAENKEGSLDAALRTMKASNQQKAVLQVLYKGMEEFYVVKDRDDRMIRDFKKKSNGDGVVCTLYYMLTTKKVSKIENF